MASFQPPLYNSDIFDSGLFSVGNETLTLEYADSRYFKIAGGVVLGSSTFNAGLSVNGTLTFNGVAANLSVISGITNGTAAASKALVLDSSSNIAGINNLSTLGPLSTSYLNNSATILAYQTWTNPLTTAMSVKLELNVNSPRFGTSTNHKMRFTANSTAILYLQTSGNVSIGSDVDTHKLYVDGSLSCTSLTVGGVPIVAGTASSLVMANWTVAQSSNSLQMTSTSVSSSGNQMIVSNANNAAYDDWTIQNYNNLTTNSAGFYIRNSNTASTGRHWIRTNGSEALGFSTRSPFTGSSANSDIFIHANVGVVSVGKSNLISSNHRLEVNGALMISDTASTTALSNSPIIGIFNSQQADTTTQGWLYMGKSLTTNSAWYWSSYYQTTSSSTVNYVRFQPVQNSSVGWLMTQDGRTSLNGPNSGGMITNPYCPLEINGYSNITIGANGRLNTSGASTAGGGTIPVSLTTTHDIWCRGVVYSTSDERTKKDIVDISDEEALKLLNVRSVHYKWKYGDLGVLQTGVIAQDLLSNGLDNLVGEVASANEEIEGNQLVVDYSSIGVLLLKLCQLQQQEINDIKSIIEQSPSLKKILRKNTTG